MNTIIELVRQHRVIDEPTKMLKFIQENERNEGHDTKMDKKSLLRIMKQLTIEKQIENITIKIQVGERVKMLHFVCEPGIDANHSAIKSAVEQAKMKLNSLPDSNSKAKKSKATSSTSSSSSTGDKIAAMSPSGFKMGKGAQPKFIMMRELHNLLFYLSRGYDGRDLSEENDGWSAESLQRQIGSLYDEQLAEELAGRKIYQEEISWKMFIPPLPSHDAFPSGWCLMSDVLVRLPLSIYVKLLQVTNVHGLSEYTSHPVRQHFLVNSLPQNLR